MSRFPISEWPDLHYKAATYPRLYEVSRGFFSVEYSQPQIRPMLYHDYAISKIWVKRDLKVLDCTPLMSNEILTNKSDVGGEISEERGLIRTWLHRFLPRFFGFAHENATPWFFRRIDTASSQLADAVANLSHFTVRSHGAAVHAFPPGFRSIISEYAPNALAFGIRYKMEL